MTNLTHNSFLYIYFNSLHVSTNLVLIIRRNNCINTTSGLCHSVSLTFSCAGRQVPCTHSQETRRPAHETVNDTEWHKPDVVLIHLILLTMSTRLVKTRRELKKIYRKNCASNWSYTKNQKIVRCGQRIIQNVTDLTLCCETQIRVCINEWIHRSVYILKIVFFPVISGSLSPRKARPQVAFGGTASNVEGSCEYIEKAVANSRQGVVLQIGGWARC